MSNERNRLKSKTEKLPRKPGIYLFKDRTGEIIYIGKAHSLQERVKSYFLSTRDKKAKQLAKEIADLDVILTDSAREAAFLENNFIRRYQPKFNLRLKDDKHFPFIKISIHEPYPIVSLVRRVEEDGSRYFGPFSPSFEARRTITLLSKVFGIRTCREKIPGRRKRACLESDLGLCSAPCVEGITSEEYKENVQNALLFLQGNVDDVIHKLSEQMKVSAKKQEFEQAAVWRDLIKTLEQIKIKPKMISVGKENIDIFGFSKEGRQIVICIFIMRNGEVVYSENFSHQILSQKKDPVILTNRISLFYEKRQDFPDKILLPFPPRNPDLLKRKIMKSAGKRIGLLVPKKGKNKKLIEFASTNARIILKRKLGETAPLSALQGIFKTKKTPYRIEGFDISNTGGEESVGSLVVFENGKPNKKEYRRYKIQTVSGPDDIASLNEVMTRRYTRLQMEDHELPDLIIVDGGKGHLNAALKTLKSLQLEDIPVLSIAKKEDIVFSKHHKQGIKLEKTSPALKLIQYIRDETHRFAISLHRKRREKKSFQSYLDGIPGIGPKRKKILLSHYPHAKSIKDAAFIDLEKLIGKKAAASLKNKFY